MLLIRFKIYGLQQTINTGPSQKLPKHPVVAPSHVDHAAMVLQVQSLHILQQGQMLGYAILKLHRALVPLLSGERWYQHSYTHGKGWVIFPKCRRGQISSARVIGVHYPRVYKGQSPSSEGRLAFPRLMRGRASSMRILYFNTLWDPVVM